MCKSLLTKSIKPYSFRGCCIPPWNPSLVLDPVILGNHMGVSNTGGRDHPPKYPSHIRLPEVYGQSLVMQPKFSLFAGYGYVPFIQKKRIGDWWLQHASTPLKNIKISWDYYSLYTKQISVYIYIWKNKTFSKPPHFHISYAPNVTRNVAPLGHSVLC